MELDPRDMRLLEKLYGIKPERKRRKRHPVVAAVMLAVLCVGGAELAACRHFEPELYERIVSPVRAAASVVWDGVCRVGDAAAQGAERMADAVSSRVEEAKASYLAWKEEREAPPPESDSVLEEPEEAPPKEMLDPLVSDLVERNGQEILTGGDIEVVYYNQTDEAWSGQDYGSDPIATHGCGPAVMAMAASSLTGEAVDPMEMAKRCVKEGYWCKSHGSYLSIVQGIAADYGLKCEAMDLKTLDEDDLYMRLSTGQIAVALMTKGHFTKGGHFILLRGTTLSGEILVADSASRDRSLIPWDWSLILDELSPSRHNGAPLWFLSAA